MSGVLVDSDVMIDVLRQRKAEVIQNWITLVESEEPLFYSPDSLAEIRHGMRDTERGSIAGINSAAASLDHNRKHFPMNGLRFHASSITKPRPH